MKRNYLLWSLLLLLFVGGTSFRPQEKTSYNVTVIYENHSNTTINLAWMADNDEYDDSAPLAAGNKFVYNFTAATLLEAEAAFSGSHPAGTLKVIQNGSTIASIACPANAPACGINISLSSGSEIRIIYE